MRKLFVERISPKMRLLGDDHKHVSLVLRAKIGDEVRVCCGDGLEYRYEIESISKTETQVRLVGQEENMTEPELSLTLFTAILKGDKNETVVRTCTELGAACFVPMTTEFTVAVKESYKIDRMQKIALEAAKQSGRGRVPVVGSPITFAEMTKRISAYDVVVFPYENATDCDIKTFLQQRKLVHKKSLRVAAIVGSEGGFSKTEVEMLTNLGAVPLSLGKRILRADTACTAVCTLILYEAGELA